MRLADYITTGQTNLSRAKLRTFLTVFAIVIGTFTLAMTTALVQGVQTYVGSQISAYAQPDTLEIGLQANERGDRQSSNGVPVYNPSQTSINQVTYMSDADLAKVKAVSGITAAYPSYSVDFNFIQYSGGEKYVFGAQSLYPDAKPLLAAGSVFDPSDQTKVLLPFAYIQTFGIATPADAVGKVVTVQLSQLPVPGGKAAPVVKQVDLTIAGVLSETLHSGGGYISYNLADTLNTFQKNGTNSGFTRIYAMNTPGLSAAAVQTITSTLTSQGYSARGYQDALSQFQRAISIARLGLDGFAGVALLAAMIGIVNTLLMAVYERTQEIGLLKALGMKRGSIFAIFLSEAITIGFWGGIVGVLLAVLFSSVANRILVKSVFSGFPGQHILSFTPLAMLEIVAGAMLLGLVAGTLPAIRASKLDPIDALRGE
jgi:putative ABC transport system permease protein